MSESMLSAGADTTETAATTAAPAPAEGTTPATAPAAAPPAPGTEGEGKPAEASTTTEGDGNKAEGKPADDAPVVKGAPEKYEDFKAPEGVLDADAVTEFKDLAKGLNLTQEDAQKVVDAAAKLAQKGSAATTQTITDTIKSTQEAWQAEVRADKEIGGTKLAENLAVAKAAMLATSTPQLQVLLDKSGLGNHPEVIRHFLKIAPLFAEDKHVPGGTNPQGGKSAAKTLYPNMA